MNMRKLVFALAFFLALGLVEALGRQATASSWPRFRGPNGTGIAADTNIPLRWTDRDILWKTAIPGVGHSSPIVWGEHIFVQSASKDGKERLLLCLSLSDGKIVWSRSIAGTGAHTHPLNNLASSTPATDGQRVYAVFWDGDQVWLYAYDFQGNLVWKRLLGGFTSQHGVGASPILYQNKVYLLYDQDGAAEVVALDAGTGKPVWRAPRPPFRACYSTPMILERPGEAPELIVVSTSGITSYNPDSGSENWNFTWTFDGMPLRTVASPVISEGLLFASSGDGDGSRHMIVVKASGKGEISKTNLAWQEKKTFPYVPSMLIYGKHLYAVNDRGIATCHVAATGEPVWNERLGNAFFASPVLIDGKIYAINENGTAYVFEAAPTFKLLAKNVVGEPVKATPAVADNRLLIRGSQHLFCICKPAEKRASAR
jgi:outer membrane protein assembly factor BamB